MAGWLKLAMAPVAGRHRRADATGTPVSCAGRRADLVAPPDRAAAEGVGGHHGDGAGQLLVGIAAVARRQLPLEGGPVGLVDIALAGAGSPAARVRRAPAGTSRRRGGRCRSPGWRRRRRRRSRPAPVHRPGAPAAARAPSPSAADARPASVVGGREAPGRGIDPGPAPGRDLDPLAVAVGRPVGVDVARIPDAAVARVVLPVAIGVELLVADHVARDVARRDRLVFEAVALGHPAIEAGAGAHRRAAHGLEVAPGGGELLLGAEGDRLAPFAEQRHPAGGHGDPGGAGRGVGLDAVVARGCRSPWRGSRCRPRCAGPPGPRARAVAAGPGRR